MIPDTLFTTLYNFSVAIYWHRLLANLLLIASFFVAPLVTAQTNSNDALVEIRFTQQQGLLTQEIIQLLDRQHYQHRELDDQFASDVFFRYLKLLDPQHIYFSKADLAPFNYLNRELDDLLVKGDLVPMAQLYNLLQQRRLAFIDFNLTALSKLEPMFNFELLEDISTSPFNDPRLSNLAAIKDNWRKQLKNVFINGQLDNETVDEIKQRLKKRYTSMRKRVLQVQLKDAYQAVSNSITTVTDPHTTYLSPRNVEDFNIDMSLSLEGIGAVLQRDDD
jgi:carboxyl-terminal processing protease